jgi:hypothetical protein
LFLPAVLNGCGPAAAPVNLEGRSFQLWIALPPELELRPSESVYLAPDAVPHTVPARVLLGSYGTATSSLQSPSLDKLHRRAFESRRTLELPIARRSLSSGPPSGGRSRSGPAATGYAGLPSLARALQAGQALNSVQLIENTRSQGTQRSSPVFGAQEVRVRIPAARPCKPLRNHLARPPCARKSSFACRSILASALSCRKPEEKYSIRR